MGSEEFASEEEVNSYRALNAGTCWWCGGAASTREHKFKHSDLKRLALGSPEPLIWGGDDGTMAPVRSLRKSDRVKFQPNLCADCNNARSQKFDLAYQKFSEYVWFERGNLWRKRHLDMHLIYQDNWSEQALQLARYVVKHAGCRISGDGFPVPQTFADFLNGGQTLEDFHICMIKNPQVWQAQRHISGRKGDPMGLWIGPMEARLSRKKKSLTAFGSTLSIGFIGFAYRWYAEGPEPDSFYRYQKARIHRGDRLPSM